MVKGMGIYNLKLKPCCKQTLKDVKQTLENGKLLTAVVAISPFAVLFGSNPLDATVSIASNDWDLWEKAVLSGNKIAKATCRKIIGLHILDHPGGELNRFWRNMYDSFA